jgi:hypothetical protein
MPRLASSWFACAVTDAVAGDPPTPLPTCVLVGDEFVPPDGADACAVILVDADGATPSPLDDLSPECADEGRDAEVVRTAPAPDGTCTAVTCARPP